MYLSPYQATRDHRNAQFSNKVLEISDGNYKIPGRQYRFNLFIKHISGIIGRTTAGKTKNIIRTIGM